MDAATSPNRGGGDPAKVQPPFLLSIDPGSLDVSRTSSSLFEQDSELLKANDISKYLETRRRSSGPKDHQEEALLALQQQHQKDQQAAVWAEQKAAAQDGDKAGGGKKELANLRRAKSGRQVKSASVKSTNMKSAKGKKLASARPSGRGGRGGAGALVEEGAGAESTVEQLLTDNASSVVDFVVPTFTSLTKPDFGSSTLATMWQHQQDGFLTDIVIRVRDQTIPCHKVVLCANCPYFESQLKSADEKEVKTDESIDPDVMMNIIRYIYGEDTNFTMEMLPNALDACHLLQLAELRDQIAAFMQERITVDNCLFWWKKGQKMSVPGLRRRAALLVGAAIGIVVASDEFMALFGDELLSLLKDGDVQMEARDELLLGCIEWVRYEPSSRTESMEDIFKYVQLEDCSLHALRTVHTKHKDLMMDLQVMDVFIEGLFKRQYREGDAKALDTLVIIGGMVNGWEEFENVSRVCLSSKTVGHLDWEEFAQIPDDALSKRCPIVCLSDGFAVLCGGEERTKNSKYDAKDKVWVDLPPTPVALRDAASVLCNNSIYILGGEGPRDTVFRLDLETSTWHEEACMLEKQLWPISTSMAESIFVVYNSVNAEKVPYTLQVLESGVWGFCSSVPLESPHTRGASLISHSDYLYLVGGYYRIAARYKVSTDQWTLLDPPIKKHNFGGAVLCRGKIYLFGHTVKQRKVSVYDIVSNQWYEVLSNLPFEDISFFQVNMVGWM